MVKKKTHKPKLVGISAFAIMCGVSRTAIYKAIELGKVIRRKTGKIDSNNESNKLYLNSRKPNAVAAKRNVTKRNLENIKDAGTPEEIDLDAEVGSKRSKAELEKVQAEVIQKKLKIKADRSMLIERRLIMSLFGELAAIDTNEFLTIPGNIAPELAGICGRGDRETILKLSKKMEKHFYGVLQHRKRVLSDWLDTVKAEASKKDDEKK